MHHLTRYLTPANLFLLLAAFLSIHYITATGDLSHYPHGKPRFLQSVHLAQELRGAPHDTVPESFVDTFSRIAPFPNDYMARNACRWSPEQNLRYCHGFPSGYVNPDFKTLASIPLEAQKTIDFIPHPFAAEYAAAGYAFYILGSVIGLTLEMPPIVIFYLSIILNTIAAIALGYYTIKLLPILQWPMCYLLLLPLSFHIRTQVMPDAINFELCLLALAISLKLGHQPLLLCRWRYGGLLLLAFFIGLIKFAYFLVPLAYLLIPARCFTTTRRKYAFAALAFVVAATAGMGWAAYAAATQYADMLAYHQRETEAFFNAPLREIFIYPFHYLDATFQAIFKQSWLLTKTGELLGTRGISNLWLASAPLLLLTLPKARNQPATAKSARLLGLTVSIGTLIILCIIMQFHRSLPWWRTPQLIQSRYLLPVLPFLLLSAYRIIPTPEPIYYFLRGAGLSALFLCLLWLHHLYV